LQGCPVDLEEAYEQAGLQPPIPLYGDDFDHYLKFKQPLEDHSWQTGMLGAIDVETREVFIDVNLSPERMRFVKAHELMHHVLGHLDFVRNRPCTPAIREQMEDEATFTGVELICPAKLFANAVREETPVGDRTSIAHLRQVAKRFDITLFTGLRRHVETTPQPVALLTARLPRNYRGCGTPRDLWVSGWVK